MRILKKIIPRLSLRTKLFIVAAIVIICNIVVGVYLHKQAQIARREAASSFHYACANSSRDSLACLDLRYQLATLKNGVPATFAQLKREYSTNLTVRADCHQLAHVIGRTEADSVQNVDTAYAQGDNFCWSGYYHGVMESIVIKIGLSHLDAKLPTICADIKAKKPYSFDHFNCVHGLGHGIMDVNGSNLFQSLQTCDLLTDTWEQQSCYGGVFMENEMDEVNPDHETAYLRSDEPMYPCTAVNDKYKGQCYLMQTSHALRLVGDNFSQVFKECSAVDASYVDTCYQSLGRDASGSSSSNAAQTKATCLLGQNLEAQQNCVIGAVKDFISYYHSDQQADAFCKSLDDTIQPICQTTKTQYYSTL